MHLPCRSEELTATYCVVHCSDLNGRERLARLEFDTSNYKRRDVGDGIDMAQVLIFFLYLGNFCTCWPAACFTRRQCFGLDDQGAVHQILVGKSCTIFKESRQTPRPRQPLGPGQPPIQSVLRGNWLDQEANQL
jgi:hypothetical protein